jgi:hypothetical protein
MDHARPKHRPAVPEKAGDFGIRRPLATEIARDEAFDDAKIGSGDMHEAAGACARTEPGWMSGL